MSDNEQLLREVHRSLAVTFGCTAPHEFGRIKLERVGFANIPKLTVPVTCHERDLPGFIPVARQAAFDYLAERGVCDGHLEFRPSTLAGRRCKFRDQHGKSRMGVRHEIRFELSPMLAAAVEWDGRRGKLPANWEVK